MTQAEKSETLAPHSSAAVQNQKTEMTLRRILAFAAITVIGFGLGRVSGLIREMVVSAYFGLSAELDAYFLAFLIPTLVNNVVAGSAIHAAVMPTLTRYLTTNQRAEFWRVASVVTNFVLLVSLALTIAGMILGGAIIAFVGGGLKPATQALATNLLIIMMPTLFLGAALNMLMAVLNALDRFTAPALIFLALNLGIIVTVFLLSPFIGVYAVAWGFLIGVTLQVVIQFVELRREQPAFHWQLDLRHPALKEVGIAFVPITALAVIAQINLLVDKAMAATLPAGSISALSYADTILGSFYALGISFGIAVFPSLSRMIAMNDIASTTRTLVSSLRLLIFILAPLTFLLVPFAPHTIGILLGRGRFDAIAVDLTAQALAMYAIGLLAFAALYVVQRAFYAFADSRMPFIVGLVAAMAHVGLNLLFMREWAHAGIALSTSLTAIVSALVLLVILQKRMPALELRSLLSFLARCGLLALIATLGAGFLFSLLGLGNESLTARVVGVLFAAIGGAFYLALAFAARIPESAMLRQTAMGFLKRN